MQGGGRAALSVEDAGAKRARGSWAGAAKGCGGDARGHIPLPRRRGSAFRPSPPVSARLRSGTASRRLGRPGGTQGSHSLSHLDLHSECERLSRSPGRPKLRVGWTSGRSDVTAHAVRQRRAGLPCHASGPTRPAEAGKLSTGFAGTEGAGGRGRGGACLIQSVL